MKLLANLHIAPRTVAFLCEQGHDVLRIDAVLPCDSPDEEIVREAMRLERIILTQDLDYSDIIALSGETRPSLVTLRLSSSRIENVNTVLARALPGVEADLLRGAIVTIQDRAIRVRLLPIGHGV